jgi:hypothetical protein
VRATGINHVSIGARDIEASTRFYAEVFGLERIPSPTFQVPVVWLRLGDLQLHLFHRGDEAPVYHHLGIDVDDFEGAYLKARELGVLDGETWGGPVRSSSSSCGSSRSRASSRIRPRRGTIRTSSSAPSSTASRSPGSSSSSAAASRSSSASCAS